MKTSFKIARVLAVGGMLATSVVLSSSSASGQDVKRIMGENFASAQKILVNLVTSNYATIPADVGIIRDHVSKLLQSPPSVVKNQEDKVMFNVYGNAVKNAATNLADVSTEIIRRDNEQKGQGELKVDYMRVAAAEYYGIMVSGCVQCHNQFRRHSVKVN